MLPQTATIESQSRPNLIRLPSALSLGQKRWAKTSFTIVTSGALSLSCSVKSRPCLKGICIVAK
jgi:hypothetical protein